MMCIGLLMEFPHLFCFKQLQSIGFIGPGLALLCLNFAKTPEVASVLITLSLSFSAFSQAGFLLNMQVRQHHSIEYPSTISQASVDSSFNSSLKIFSDS